MAFSSNNLPLLYKALVERVNQHKPAPKFSIADGKNKRKQLLNNRRRSSRLSILDSNRCLIQEINKNTKSQDELKQRLQKLLKWKRDKERNKKIQLANKIKPFLTGTVKTSLCYIPPPPPNFKRNEHIYRFQAGPKEVNIGNKSIKNNNEHKVNTNIMKHKFVSKGESNLATTCKGVQSSDLVKCPKKEQMVCKKLPTPPVGQSNLVNGILRTRKDCDNEKKKGQSTGDSDAVLKMQLQLDLEVRRILRMCKSWDNIRKTSALPNAVQEMVLAATGQGRLLVSKKLAQFRSLIDECKRGTTGAPCVTPQDLHGFWDMVYIQVKDVNQRFGKLERLKANHWEEEYSNENNDLPKSGKTKDTLKPQKKKAVTSRIHDSIIDKKMKIVKKTPVIFHEDGLFSVQSPAKPSTSHNNTSPPVPASASTESPFEEQVGKTNEWVKTADENKKPSKKGQTKVPTKCQKKKSPVTSRIRDLIIDARKAMKGKKKGSVKILENFEIFEAGFSTITNRSPTKTSPQPGTPQRKRTPFKEQNVVARASETL